MELRDATETAMELRSLYEALESELHGRPWDVSQIALGFVGDVGDLAKLVQAAAGVRAIPDARAKLAHELADCLWAILVLAHELDVDLEAAFEETMVELKTAVRSRLGSPAGGSG